MNRSILALAIALATLAIAAPQPAYAQAPTPAQMEKAKKAFAEGKKLFEKGDFPEAVGKFKESYNLSKNPVLLYNIGFANESAGQDDIALFYYRKFLTDAPADAAQRGEVVDRVKALEKKFAVGGTGNGGATEPVKTEPVKTEPVKAEPVKTAPVKIKPAGTYSATDFQHMVIDVAPPKKPLDVTAFVPEDSGFEVTLYFRTAGEGKFTARPMKWRYKELVARIPPEKMIGDSLQYYVEVKDQTGAVVTRNAKSTSPNLVTLEVGATPRFYPDFTDEGVVQTPVETTAEDTEEDPLTGKKKTVKKVTPRNTGEGIEIQPQPGTGNGFADVGSSKFKYMKWGSTIGAAAMLGLSVLFYVQAGNYSKALEDEAKACGSPPCGLFDDYNANLESSGKSRQTWSTVTLVVGIGAAGLATYYWYKELKAKKRGETKVSATSASPEASWSVVPTITDGTNGFLGAAAAGRF
ncbi:MAG: Thiol-disulfide isomerase [Myxococcales bacterium]|nr:Thiol-disulfide isomerase [Myxococcales bacterium]